MLRLFGINMLVYWFDEDNETQRKCWKKQTQKRIWRWMESESVQIDDNREKVPQIEVKFTQII